MSSPSLLERAAMPFTGLSAGVFATLSRLRGHRVFHPHGEAFEGKLSFNRNASRWLPDVLARPREHDVIVRFSRAVGLPKPLPDLFGMAIKIPAFYGPGWDQDLLLVTSRTDPVGRHLLVPTLNLLGRPYSSVLPYRRKGDGLVTFGAIPRRDMKARSIDQLRTLVEDRQVAFDLTIAEEGSEHVIIGTVLLTKTSALPEKSLRFNPWSTSSELKPAGGLNRLRRDAYKASQRARPDTDEDRGDHHSRGATAAPSGALGGDGVQLHEE